MTAQTYLQQQLETCARHKLSDADTDIIQSSGIEAFIYAKLTTKKFRKWAMNESSELQAKRAIALNVAANKPIQFRYPFGGYKLWRMPGAPEVDWAEFLAIAYIATYLAPIAAAYAPGVELVFASDDMIVERMNNIAAADTNAYFNSFKALLAVFRKQLPENFTVDIVRVGDLYQNKPEMEAEFATLVEKVKYDYEHVLDPEKKKRKMVMSELNINWQGAEDFTKFTAEEKQQFVTRGAIYHDAYCMLSKRQQFNRGDEKIVIFTMLVPNAIAIGTTKRSVTKFWTGLGVLEQSGSDFHAKVIAPSGLENLTATAEVVAIPGLSGKNFRQIQVQTAPIKP